MELRGGEERVFPVQLMMVRRSRDGTARSILLSEEGSNHCISVIEVFSRCTGKSRNEIEKELKIVELKSQNPKILRGLALLMFRLSRMERASPLDPPAVREAVFSRCKTPAVTMEERINILEEIATEMGATRENVEKAMYADLEDNEVLGKVAEISPENLAQRFNIEQIETVMLKAQHIDITTSTNRSRFIRRIRSLGLLYSEIHSGDRHVLRVSGPVSILEHSERYGSRFALLIRYMLKFSDWEIDARVSLKKGDEKSDFNYHLDNSVSEFTGTDHGQEEKLPFFVNANPDPVVSGKSIFYPDYSVKVGARSVNIFITNPRYYEEDMTELGNLSASGDSEIICITAKSEKCPKNAFCFRETVDWELLKKRIESNKLEIRKEIRKEEKREERLESMSIQKGKEINDEVIKHLKALYPDSIAMVDYLDFMGYPPAETLEKAGYKVIWKGLRIVVQ